MKLGDVCEIKSIRGISNIKNKKEKYTKDEKVPVYIINGKDITQSGEINFDNKIINKDLPYTIVNKRLLKPDDIIISPRNIKLKLIIWKRDYPKSICEDNLCILRIKDNLYSAIILSYILKFKQNEILTYDKNNKGYIKKSTLMDLEIPEFDDKSRMKIEMKLLALDKKRIETMNIASAKCRCYINEMNKCIFK